MRSMAVVLAALAVALAAVARADDEAWRPDGRNVLVIYQADDTTCDAAGRGESKNVAEYYALRRRVPPENLLGVNINGLYGSKGSLEYKDFYDRILKPVSERLAKPGPDGKSLSQRICYIAICPPVPYAMNTHHADKDDQNWFGKTSCRSVSQFLISVEANLLAGVNEQTGAPGPGAAGPLGSVQQELVLPIFGQYSRPEQARHFRQLRSAEPGKFDFYLVTHLGVDYASARDMIDGGLYAQRYLRLGGPDETAVFQPAIWLDQKYKFAADHVLAMSRAAAIVQGIRGGGFDEGKGLRRVWPLVIDNQIEEIGLEVDGAQHKPTVTSVIAPDGVSKEGIRLIDPRQSVYPDDVPGVFYFPPGGRLVALAKDTPVSNPATAPAKAAAVVIGMDFGKNRLLLDSTRNFAPGDIVAWVWPGRFPADDVFLFYGFYGLDTYEDVVKWPAGAVGIHVDSCCMTWARGAIHRGIAATFGVTAEPLSAGIPYGDQALLALASGYDWAEASFGGLRLGQRWAGVVLGDPLYAPFRSLMLQDKTAPVLAPVDVRVEGDKATLSVSLAGTNDDELADVALFRLEYGPSASYGKTVEFYDWPSPEKSRDVPGRRFGYSRHFRTVLTGLGAGPVHYRLTARDPAGHQTSTPDLTFPH
jgi:uncharacterized protein (TIGR03790 family)